MIVNGKYVEFDEKASAVIQTKVNKIDNLKVDVKSDVKPLEVLSDNYGTDFEYQASGYSMFGDSADEIIDRKSRYQYYREMDEMEFIHRGLEIVADDSTQSNTDGDVIKILSSDEGIKEKLTDLFIERLDMNNELWSIFYETVKMGDNFYEIVPDDYKNPKKIVFLKYLTPEKVVKIMKNGKISHYEYTIEEEKDLERISDKKIKDFVASARNKSGSKTSNLVFKLQPWQVVHFNISDKDLDPYGGSLLKAGIRTFRRLSLLEDVILVYRISRAPERRVFYIDVGKMNNTDAKRFMQRIKNQYRTSNFIDENGNINKKANVMSITSDIFVPQSEGGGGTKIDTLQGGEGLKSIDDLKYFKDKILRIMNIPPAYLGEEADRSRGTLSALDIKFGRFIERIQAQILKGINKIAALELFFAGEKKDSLSNFKIELTPPSNIKEITDIDLISQRMNLISVIQGLQLFSNEWILKNILKMSDKEIADISLQKSLQPQQQQDGMGGDMGMAGGDMGMAGGDMGMEGGDMGMEGENAGMNAPQEISTNTPQSLTASTLVKVLGKEFLVENSDDFAKMMKYLKEDNVKSNIPILEGISKIVTAPLKVEKAKKAENIRRQFIIGEFTGLEWDSGYGKSIKLFEKRKGNESIVENTIYRYNTINE